MRHRPLLLTVVAKAGALLRGRSGMLAVAAGVVLSAALHGTAWLERVDGLLFDGQVRMLRSWRAAPVRDDDGQVAIVGIDGATLEQAGVPLALLHQPLGAALQAIAGAGARAIAIDLVLPGRSVERLLPGADAALTRALGVAGRLSAVVFVLEPDADGHLRAPFDPFVAALGERGLVTALLPVDGDGVVRRFDPALSAPGLRTLAGEISYRLGVGERVRQPGWIDYTRGRAFGYTPLIEVARAGSAGAPRLRTLFEGRVVLIGSVLPYSDSVAQPVSLLAWTYPGTAPPAVVVHAQLLRSILGHGLIRAAPPGWWVAATLLLALVAAMPGTWLRWAALVAASLLAFAIATLLHGEGWHVGLGAPLAAAVIATGLRTTVELSLAQRGRAQLERSFAGYLSPQVLDAICADRLGSTGRREMAFVFADVRGFTTWSETTPAEQVFETLNRYFAAITPRIHQDGGTIDNFRGDGIMILFGAPEPHADPCGAAFAAARHIVAEGRRLFGAACGPTGRGLDMTVGISFGEAIYGDLGSRERKDFTAIGDAANVAARLQELAKTLDYPILMTCAVSERLGTGLAAGLAPVPLGQAPLRGHSPVAIAGWRPLP